MLEQFQGIEDTYNDVERRMSDPEIMADQTIYQDLVKKHAELEESVGLFRRLKTVIADIDDANGMKDDPDMKAYMEEELARLKAEQQELEKKLKVSLLPKDPEDEKNAIVEIRSGTGGDEAALFAGTL